MREPVISILMPVFDAERTLTEALTDIRGQSFRDWELVAVDDGSTDASAQILEAAGREEPRVRALRREHAGIAEALNAGLQACRGEWIARMDADDRMSPERLEAQLEWAKAHPDVALTGCLVEHLYDPEEMPNTTGMLRFIRWVNSLRTPEEIGREIFVDCPVPHPTFFLKKETLEVLGGYRAGEEPEDYRLVLEMHSRGLRMGKVDRVLVGWRDSAGRASRTRAAYSAAAFRRMKVEYLRRLWLPERQEFYQWGAGEVGKRMLRSLQEQDLSPLALVDLDPRKIGQVIHGCPVWSVEQLFTEWPEGPKVLCAVGAPGARADIRARMALEGRQEGQDYLFCA